MVARLEHPKGWSWLTTYRCVFKQELILSACVGRGENVFVTGGGGVGKSHLLRMLVSSLRACGKRVAVTATTGVAGLQIGGTTLHSFVGLGLAEESVDELVKKLLEQRRDVRKRLRETDVLIVDEISMMPPAYFYKVDRIARSARERPDAPFGGMQLVMFGDFFQLPPVNRNRPVGAEQFCFQLPDWERYAARTYELSTVWRQKDPGFAELLQRVRRGDQTADDVALLRTRVRRPAESLPIDAGAVRPTRLYCYKKDVEEVNNAFLRKIAEPTFRFRASFSVVDLAGRAVNRATSRRVEAEIKKNCPVPDLLLLKRGAQVMLVTNHLGRAGLVNGSRGVVEGFAGPFPRVRFANGRTVTVGPHDWTVRNEAAGYEARLTHVPLILGDAITIHKCQGMTFDDVEIDIGRTFDDGQAYVALSRASTLDGMHLLSFHPSSIRTNATVREYYDGLRRSGSGKKRKFDQLYSDGSH